MQFDYFHKIGRKRINKYLILPEEGATLTCHLSGGLNCYLFRRLRQEDQKLKSSYVI